MPNVDYLTLHFQPIELASSVWHGGDAGLRQSQGGSTKAQQPTEGSRGWGTIQKPLSPSTYVLMLVKWDRLKQH